MLNFQGHITAELSKTIAVTLLASSIACSRDRPVTPAMLPDAGLPSTVMNEMAAAVPIGRSAVLIAEADFVAALGARQGAGTSGNTLSLATRVASLANTSAALGAFGAIDPTRTTFDGDFFVVVRDPLRGRSDEFVEARDFYLASVRLSGRANWVGRDPHIALDTDIPLPVRGTCGLLEAPGGRSPCPGPRCPPAAFMTGASPAAEGGGLGTSRVPLHVFDPSGFSLWICQPFERTPNGSLPPGPVLDMGTEACNGLDDDGDGTIDENNVCANRDVMCSASLLPQPGFTHQSASPALLAALSGVPPGPGGSR